MVYPFVVFVSDDGRMEGAGKLNFPLGVKLQ
jgi:hypothetical protein